MKFALISQVLPPLPSGQAMVLYRLLKGLDSDSYCLISQAKAGKAQGNCSDTLSSNYYYLPLEFKSLESSGPMAKWRQRLELLIGIVLGAAVVLRGRRIARILEQEKCEAVVACTSAELLDLPAGYLASRLTGTAFYAYIFDDYSNIWPKMKFFARRYERFVLKRASGVIVPNEFLRDELHRRHGVEAIVIHNPCDTTDYQTPASEDPQQQSGRDFKIIYTGAMYEAHYEAFRNLIKAMKTLGQRDLNLHVYTTCPQDELRANGIDGPIVYHEHEAAALMPGIQRQADLLFLPLAFNTPYPDVIRTAAPGKLGEYLAARRPVLVHAPKDSYVAWYFRNYECGLVVDENDPAKLAQAIERILSDASLRQRLSENAWARANIDFSIETAQRKFTDLMKSKVATPV
jgi:glycosyltransferase involved in cell wall biosynthesis